LQLSIEDVPLSTATQSWLEGQIDMLQAYETLLSGGDDYELLFTAAPAHAESLVRQARKLGQNITKVGRVIKWQEPSIITSYKRAPVSFKKTGYTHKIL